ncbi:MAG: hypothetical protein JO152_17050 [Mycobacteriaceae bacterium]|nr:hypothetical protein [Mycobacteriaceae bacterium]
MRSTVAVLAAVLTTGAIAVAPPAAADNDPTDCNYPSCTPGIMPNVVLGANCDNTTYYAFGVTSWGRLVFCGSPRRYEPRWFRSPEMHGVKKENSPCPAMDGHMAQAPDGLILTCLAANGASLWTRGDT